MTLLNISSVSLYNFPKENRLYVKRPLSSLEIKRMGSPGDLPHPQHVIAPKRTKKKKLFILLSLMLCQTIRHFRVFCFSFLQKKKREFSTQYTRWYFNISFRLMAAICISAGTSCFFWGVGWAFLSIPTFCLYGWFLKQNKKKGQIRNTLFRGTNRVEKKNKIWRLGLATHDLPAATCKLLFIYVLRTGRGDQT